MKANQHQVFRPNGDVCEVYYEGRDQMRCYTFAKEQTRIIGKIIDDYPKDWTWRSKEFLYHGSIIVKHELKSIPNLQHFEKTGHGELYFVDKSVKYIGFFSKNKYHGFGILDNGTEVIVSNFVHGNPEGIVHISSKSTDHVYFGEFKKNQKCGEGTLLASPNMIVRGKFLGDKAHCADILTIKNPHYLIDILAAKWSIYFDTKRDELDRVLKLYGSTSVATIFISVAFEHFQKYISFLFESLVVENTTPGKTQDGMIQQFIREIVYTLIKVLNLNNLTLDLMQTMMDYVCAPILPKVFEMIIRRCANQNTNLQNSIYMLQIRQSIVEKKEFNIGNENSDNFKKAVHILETFSRVKTISKFLKSAERLDQCIKNMIIANNMKDGKKKQLGADDLLPAKIQFLLQCNHQAILPFYETLNLFYNLQLTCEAQDKPDVEIQWFSTTIKSVRNGIGSSIEYLLKDPSLDLDKLSIFENAAKTLIHELKVENNSYTSIQNIQKLCYFIFINRMNGDLRFEVSTNEVVNLLTSPAVEKFLDTLGIHKTDTSLIVTERGNLNPYYWKVVADAL